MTWVVSIGVMALAVIVVVLVVYQEIRRRRYNAEIAEILRKLAKRLRSTGSTPE